MSIKFDEIITDQQRFREIFNPPSQVILDKNIDHIDDICAAYINASPFIIISTLGADGLISTSPKGDPAGFVQILDHKTLAIPERLGNHRCDSFENILVNPNIGVIFIIPGFGVTLRVSGTAQIVRDEKLQQSMAINGKQPNAVLIVNVEQAFAHCSKAIMRGKIWQSDAWPDSSQLPNLGVAMVTHSKLSTTAEKMQEIVINDENTRLY